MITFRSCRDADLPAMLEIINAAAYAYRGVIPDDRWHEPYMPPEELRAAIADGIEFTVCEEGGELRGLMGIQPVRDVDLIRHAYVRPGAQRGGIGTALLRQLTAHATRRILVGTWRDARWAIDFYRRNGFVDVAPDRARTLLVDYWSIPQRQIDTSVVLEFGGRL